MTSAELKSDLHKYIVEINDINVLTQVLEYLRNAVKSNNADWWDSLTTEQKESINKGIEQLDNGEGIPHEKVREGISNLLDTNG